MTEELIKMREEAKEHGRAAIGLVKKGQIYQAIDHLNASLVLAPTAEAYTTRGWAYSKLGKYAMAIADCRKALKIDPDLGNGYNDIGAYLIQTGDYEEALIYLELALRSKRYSTKHYSWSNIGIVYERHGLWLDALRYYKNALALEPDYSLAKEAFINLQAKLN